MESESTTSGRRDPLKTVISVLLALVLLAFGVIGYVIYDNLQGSDRTLTVIQDGDTVLMNYVGMFEDGRVFDTSLYEIAVNDALYPKSFTFTLRDEATYDPFEMTAGLYGESGGTIKGFALGVIGLKLNQKSIIVVTPDDGYAVDPSMVETIDLVEEVPIVETLLETEFRSLFGVAPTLMAILPHYEWGWDVLVTEVASGFVKIKSIPVVGEYVTPYGDPDDSDDPMGWRCVVESYDPSFDGGVGKIGVRHLLTEQDTYMRQGVDYLGNTFVLSAVDETGGTFDIHKIDLETGYNGELSGRTLLFEVTILAIS